jgi:hypothetical protein
LPLLADALPHVWLSCPQVETGLRVLLDAKLRKDRSGRSVADTLSPAIARAFHAAKDAKKGRGGLEDDEVNRSEFRLLLVALKRYSELLTLFDAIDLSDDRRIDMSEFKKSLPLLRQWGVVVHDSAAEFARIDANGGGLVLFDEVCVCMCVCVCAEQLAQGGHRVAPAL